MMRFMGTITERGFHEFGEFGLIRCELQVTALLELLIPWSIRHFQWSTVAPQTDTKNSHEGCNLSINFQQNLSLIFENIIINYKFPINKSRTQHIRWWHCFPSFQTKTLKHHDSWIEFMELIKLRLIAD